MHDLTSVTVDDTCEFRAHFDGGPVAVERFCHARAVVAWFVRLDGRGPVVSFAACEAHGDRLARDLERLYYVPIGWAAREVA